MAQQITFWKMEGKSDIEIKTMRLRTKKDISEIMTQKPSNCDIVTLDRTDGQSNITHEIWKSLNYIALNER